MDQRLATIARGVRRVVDYNDINAFIELSRQYDRDHVSKWFSRMPLSDERIRRTARGYYSHSSGIFLYTPKEAEGFVIAGTFNDTGEIKHIYSRKKGGGSALLEAAEDHLEEQGANKLELIVHWKNIGSVGDFFTKHDYIARGYSSGDYVKFNKQLRC